MVWLEDEEDEEDSKRITFCLFQLDSDWSLTFSSVFSSCSLFVLSFGDSRLGLLKSIGQGCSVLLLDLLGRKRKVSRESGEVRRKVRSTKELPKWQESTKVSFSIGIDTTEPTKNTLWSLRKYIVEGLKNWRTHLDILSSLFDITLVLVMLVCSLTQSLCWFMFLFNSFGMRLWETREREIEEDQLLKALPLWNIPIHPTLRPARNSPW